MKITICGSMQFKDAMLEAARRLQEMGYGVATPNIHEGHTYEGKTDEQRAAEKDGFMRAHFAKVEASDAVLIVNEAKHGVEGYIGGNTLMEMAFAYSQGIEIFLLNEIPDVSYAWEIRGMKPVVLDGQLEAIDEYFKKLPLLYVSSKSPIKHLAVSRGLRRAGIRTNVVGLPAESGVAEQPLSIDETYEGALNRHAALAREAAGRAQYLATIESGIHMVHKNHNSFGCTVVVLEQVGGERKVGIGLDPEFPRSMTDKVPSVYPDLGVLVQKEFGSALKDPFPFFTNGRINRQKVMENAVFNVAVQLPAPENSSVLID